MKFSGGDLLYLHFWGILAQRYGVQFGNFT